MAAPSVAFTDSDITSASDRRISERENLRKPVPHDPEPTPLSDYRVAELARALSILDELLREESMARQGYVLPGPPRIPAIAFVDVSGYTTMTEKYGDEVALRTSEIVRDQGQAVARQYGGSVVKISAMASCSTSNGFAKQYLRFCNWSNDWNLKVFPPTQASTRAL